MDKDKMNERLLKTSVWMRSNNFYIRMKAELLQVFLRKELLNIEMMSPSRTYTKKKWLICENNIMLCGSILMCY